jgi:hypothetical protein
MSLRLVSVLCLAFGLSAVGGCGPAPLNESRNYDLAVGEARAMMLSPQPKPQKLTVTFSSTEGDVNVLVFNESDLPNEEAQLTVDAKKAIASKKGKSETFTVDVPAKTSPAIVVRDAAKKTQVSLSVTNRK